MNVNGSADQGHVVQGMIVKVKPQGDGTIKFDVVCHDSKGRVAHRERFLLPSYSESAIAVVRAGKGCLACVVFEKTGRERDRPTEVTLV